jgi:hypothetical protein
MLKKAETTSFDKLTKTSRENDYALGQRLDNLKDISEVQTKSITEINLKIDTNSKANTDARAVLKKDLDKESSLLSTRITDTNAYIEDTRNNL